MIAILDRATLRAIKLHTNSPINRFLPSVYDGSEDNVIRQLVDKYQPYFLPPRWIKGGLAWDLLNSR